MIWTKRKPQTHYVTHGYVNFSVDRKTKKLSYGVYSVTKQHHTNLYHGTITDENHLKRLLLCKTLDQVLEFAESPNRNEVLQ